MSFSLISTSVSCGIPRQWENQKQPKGCECGRNILKILDVQSVNMKNIEKENSQTASEEGLVRQVDLSKDDLGLLVRLSGNKDFLRFRVIAETYLQKNATDLLSYNFKDDLSLSFATHDARGGYRFWRQLMRAVDVAEELLVNEEKDGKQTENS